MSETIWQFDVHINWQEKGSSAKFVNQGHGLTIKISWLFNTQLFHVPSTSNEELQTGGSTIVLIRHRPWTQRVQTKVCLGTGKEGYCLQWEHEALLLCLLKKLKRKLLFEVGKQTLCNQMWKREMARHGMCLKLTGQPTCIHGDHNTTAGMSKLDLHKIYSAQFSKAFLDNGKVMVLIVSSQEIHCEEKDTFASNWDSEVSSCLIVSVARKTIVLIGRIQNCIKEWNLDIFIRLVSWPWKTCLANSWIKQHKIYSL